MTSHNRVQTSASLALLTTVFLALGTNAFGALYYDVASATRSDGPLAPQVSGGSGSALSATPLTGVGLAASSESYGLDGTGKYVFGGWAQSNPGFTGPRFEFSLTANQELLLNTISYSFMTANYSDLWFGPASLSVWVSKDGFATGTLVAQHSLLASKPPGAALNNITDSLSSLGVLEAGETLSLRLVAWGEFQFPPPPPKWNGIAGLWNTSGNFNPTLDFTPVPEPGTWGILSGLALLGVAAGRSIRRLGKAHRLQA